VLSLAFAAVNAVSVNAMHASGEVRLNVGSSSRLFVLGVSLIPVNKRRGLGGGAPPKLFLKLAAPAARAQGQSTEPLIRK
jgi:hypothetical protein